MVSPRAMSCAGTTMRTVLAKAEPASTSISVGISAKMPRKTKSLRVILAPQLGCLLQHLVCCRDNLGIHFIGTLGGDQRRDLVHRIDVGGFQKALLDGAVAGRAGHAGLGRAGTGGFGVKGVAEGAEGGFV